MKLFSSMNNASLGRWDMKVLVTVLLLLLALLQYKLWIANGGIPETLHLKQAVVQQTDKNQLFMERNRVLSADVNNLKSGQQAIEERARNDLGMVKKGEVFYQVIS